MIDAHDNLSPFLDGELTPSEAAKFEVHLAGCTRCQSELADFVALDAVASVDLLVSKQSSSVTPSAAKRSQGAALNSKRLIPWALAAAVPLGLLSWFLLSPPAPKHTALALGPTRPFEARLSWGQADAYRPYAPTRSIDSHGEAIPAAVLADLEKTGETRSLACAWLLSGNIPRAKQVLAQLPATADVESDQAAVALVEGDFEAALAHAQAALDRVPTHSQARWNRALALEKQGLVLAAALAFEQLEPALGTGWPAEASDRARQLRDELAASQRRSQQALDAGALMVLQGVPMPDALVRVMPSWARMSFRYALLSAMTPSEVRSLAPTAQALDAYFGGRWLSEALERHAVLDPRQRAAFAPGFRALMTDAYLALRPTGFAPSVPSGGVGLGEGVAAYVAQLRKAKAWAYLLFALPMGRQLGSAWDDYVKAVRAEPDPFFGLAVELELARRDGAGGEGLAQERRLLELVNSATRLHAGLRALQAQEQLTALYSSQHRIVEATHHGLQALQLARSQGDFAATSRVMQSLADAARFRNAAALSAALLEERSLRLPDDCEARAYFHESVAAMRIVSLEPEAARTALALVPTCDTPLSVVGLGVLADLLRLAPRPEDSERFEQAAAALRARSMDESEALLVDHFEARARLDRDPIRGTALLRSTLVWAQRAQTADAVPLKVRAHGFGLLRSAAGEEGRWGEMFSLTQEELDGPLAQRCALVVEVQDNRLTAAARGADGRESGLAHRFALDQSRPEGLRPEELAAQLAPLARRANEGCGHLAVYASYPLHGSAGWLPDDVAWSYSSRASGRVRGNGNTLVVHDVATPTALNLPRIARWSQPLGEGVVELTGDAASPARVLAAMSQASFIELHVHGLVNPANADTASLVLAPDDKGRFSLSAFELRSLRLEGAPLVALAACRASSVAPYLHEPWSLPRAFLNAGASVVIAAPVDLPDTEASQFFAKVLARVRRGQDAATAMRDERVEFLQTRQGASWVRSVLVFD